jgi:hypothetical protein
MPTHLVQIVPPGAGGVRDYALALQSQWAQADRSSDLLALDADATSRQHLHQRLRPLAAGGTAAVSADTCVLLHFSGYGFHPRGLCFWLLRELRALQSAFAKAGGKLRLTVMFHELFASSPPWQSAFWLQTAQAHIAKQLAHLADAVWTNSTHHASWLSRHMQTTAPLHVRPVFSTMGEPREVALTATRQHGLVVFGSASTRQRALHLLTPHLLRLQALGIGALIEAGSGPPTRYAAAWPGYRFAGKLDDVALIQLLQQNLYALIDYPCIHMGKSTVFAAYAANGCVVLNTAAPHRDANCTHDGLRDGQHYLSLQGLLPNRLDGVQLAALSAAAKNWYAQHTLPQQASEFSQFLQHPATDGRQVLATGRLPQDFRHEASRG